MKTSKTPIVLVSSFCLSMIGLYFALTFLSLQRHEARVQREANFHQIGQKVASKIRDAQQVPKTAGDLWGTGWLSISDWKFIEQNRVVYVPSVTNASEEEIILRMPYSRGLNLVIQRDGYMRKESNGSEAERERGP